MGIMSGKNLFRLSSNQQHVAVVLTVTVLVVVLTLLIILALLIVLTLIIVPTLSMHVFFVYEVTAVGSDGRLSKMHTSKSHETFLREPLQLAILEVSQSYVFGHNAHCKHSPREVVGSSIEASKR